MIKEKDIIITAKIFSSIFSPFYVPLLAFALMFLFTYLSVLPLSYKLLVLITIYSFTVLIPRVSISAYRKFNGWSSRELGHKEKRIVPYAISFVSYIFCLIMMHRLNMPLYMCGIIKAALITIILCSVTNIWWKISTHMAGMGGLIGALLSFSLLFSFNPIWWLCLAIMCAGFLGTSRIVLRQHTLAQVTAGFWMGLVCAVLSIRFA